MQLRTQFGVLCLATSFLALSCTSRDAGSSGREVEVAAFKGGYGIDFYETSARELEAKQPGVKFNVWGNPRVWEQLRPRFVAGSPPDITFPGWDMGYWALVYENQLDAWDEALDGKPFEGDGTWRDTFEPSLMKLGRHEGKQYLMPFYYNMNGWWYDPVMFEKNGWKPPVKWAELLSLCEQMKAKGIAPITYQGKYPYYMITGFLFPWVISSGGIQALDDAQNLVPGAWKSPAFLRAAQMIKQLRDRGLFQQGASGMSHTEAQMEFVHGRAAMIPCGTWLHSEMNKVIPAGFRMEFFLPPVSDQDMGDPTNVCIGIEPWVIPAKAKNKAQAIEFFKYMTSLAKAKQFVEQKGTLTAIKGSDQAKLPPHLQQPAKAFRESKTVWSVEYIQWYPKLGTETQNAMAALLNGEITPEQFVERCESAADVARNDDDLPKHKIQRD